MRVVLDLEANGLEAPTEVWVICCLDIDTGDLHTFRKVTSDEKEKERFLAFSKGVTLWVGHNFLGYDYRVLKSLLGLCIDVTLCIDTLIISQLVNFSRPQKHSLESYGIQFGLPKLPFSDFTQYTPEMEVYCARDTEVCRLIYEHYLPVISDVEWQRSIRMEHKFQLVCNALHRNGFSFNSVACRRLLDKITLELEALDKEILHAFPPTLAFVKEVTPKFTKHGTLSKVGFKFVTDGDLSVYNGGPFSRCALRDFNPGSPRQIVEVLNKAGWRPVNKTKTHTTTERELLHIERSPISGADLALRKQELYNKLVGLKKTGWKVDEKNLDTLPSDAPSPARTLAKRILLESRRRTLTEWLSLVQLDGRIHGQFFGIGCWTQRMSHRHPNTANIPTSAKLYGAEMRALWCAPRKRLLVGVDAEAIQLRIFAHYINDPDFTKSLVEGRKSDGTDPHSLNHRVLGSSSRKGRSGAKNFIFAFLLGGAVPKLSTLLGCSHEECEEGLKLFYKKYSGLVYLKKTIIPQDAARGWFRGLDGRKVPIPGASESQRKHLAMSGYLQNGEALIMKYACILWCEKLCPSIFS